MDMDMVFGVLFPAVVVQFISICADGVSMTKLEFKGINIPCQWHSMA